MDAFVFINGESREIDLKINFRKKKLLTAQSDTNVFYLNFERVLKIQTPQRQYCLLIFDIYLPTNYVIDMKSVLFVFMSLCGTYCHSQSIPYLMPARATTRKKKQIKCVTAFMSIRICLFK